VRKEEQYEMGGVELHDKPACDSSVAPVDIATTDGHAAPHAASILAAAFALWNSVWSSGVLPCRSVALTSPPASIRTWMIAA
jgi:hypothetical protein